MNIYEKLQILKAWLPFRVFRYDQILTNGQYYESNCISYKACNIIQPVYTESIVNVIKLSDFENKVFDILKQLNNLIKLKIIKVSLSHELFNTYVELEFNESNIIDLLSVLKNQKIEYFIIDKLN